MNQNKLEVDKNMPVVIFCGGYGSRIREETTDKPKPMINIGKFPVLWHIMKIYSHYGFNNFILTLGYKGDYVRDYLKRANGKIFSKFNITCVDTGESTKTGGRLKLCEKYLGNKNFFCTYGDGVSDINLIDLLKFHNSFKNISGTITGVKIPHKFGIISYNKKGKLKKYQKGHLMNEPINAGFMVLEREYLDYLNLESEVEEPFNVLAQKNKMAVFNHDGFFGAFDTYRDLKDLNDQWEKSPKWKVWKD